MSILLCSGDGFGRMQAVCVWLSGGTCALTALKLNTSHHPNEVWWVPQVSLCLPLIRADQGLLWGSSGLQNRGERERFTDLRI